MQTTERTPSELSLTLLNCFEEILEQYNKKIKSLNKVNNMLLDIQHEIENDNKINAAKGCLISKKIHQLRNIRRNLKNDIELLELMIISYEIKDKLSSYKTNNNILQGKHVKLQRLRKNKVYNTRIIRDMDKFLHEKEIQL